MWPLISGLGRFNVPYPIQIGYAYQWYEKGFSLYNTLRKLILVKNSINRIEIYDWLKIKVKKNWYNHRARAPSAWQFWENNQIHHDSLRSSSRRPHHQQMSSSARNWVFPSIPFCAVNIYSACTGRKLCVSSRLKAQFHNLTLVVKLSY